MAVGDAANSRSSCAESSAKVSRLNVPSYSELNTAVRLAAGDLGRVDEAVAYAIESVQRCDHLGLFWARAPFAGDAMRAHPRYPELLRAMGL